MATIRNDVVGVFHTAAGILKAGDEVPGGIRIHERYLVEGSYAGEAERVAVDVPSRNASKAEWQDFLTDQMVVFPEDSTRNELIELWDSATE